MCDQIANVDFQVSIIGAGAYGLPLASFVKRLGKQAIHLGGATQLLFGIRGRRWETDYASEMREIFNENWIRPSETETPEKHEKVDKGCYW
jgi:glycerol-3-phosphate dehydrogenase